MGVHFSRSQVRISYVAKIFLIRGFFYFFFHFIKLLFFNFSLVFASVYTSAQISVLLRTFFFLN